MSVVFLLNDGHEGSPAIERVPEGTLSFDVVLVKIPTSLPITTHSRNHILPYLLVKLFLLRIVQLQSSKKEIVQIYPYRPSPVGI